MGTFMRDFVFLFFFKNIVDRVVIVRYILRYRGCIDIYIYILIKFKIIFLKKDGDYISIYLFIILFNSCL